MTNNKTAAQTQKQSKQPNYIIHKRIHKSTQEAFQHHITSNRIDLLYKMDIDNDWNQEDGNDDVGVDNDWNQEELAEGFQQSIQDQPLLMRFCPRDSSMLYPKENKSSRSLEYACRLCQYTEQSENPLIFRNVIKKEVKNVLHTVPSAISDDPTLARSQNAACESCGHHEAVFFQSDTGQSDSLALIFVCCRCDHKWVQ